MYDQSHNNTCVDTRFCATAPPTLLQGPDDEEHIAVGASLRTYSRARHLSGTENK